MSEAPKPARAGPQTSYQVTLLAEAGKAEAIASRLEETIEPRALAVSLFDRGMGCFEVSALYAERPHEDALVAALDAAHGAVSIEPLAAADWVTLSQGKRGPVQAGRFLVHGSHDRDRAAKRRLAIEIDAGQAFGTAHHASTRGCLLALDDLLKRERPRVILDVGTGTGILAIAADNARKNRAGTLISTVTARGFAHPSLRQLAADLLLANLLERALYALAPELARRVKPGRTAILSGLTQTQARTIEARNSAFGFILEKRIVLDGWTTLVLRRRKDRAVGD